MSEANRHASWAYVKSVDPTVWYPQRLGFLVRLRSIFTALIVQFISVGVSAGLGYWLAGLVIFVVELNRFAGWRRLLGAI